MYGFTSYGCTNLWFFGTLAGKLARKVRNWSGRFSERERVANISVEDACIYELRDRAEMRAGNRCFT